MTMHFLRQSNTEWAAKQKSMSIWLCVKTTPHTYWSEHEMSKSKIWLEVGPRYSSPGDDVYDLPQNVEWL